MSGPDSVVIVGASHAHGALHRDPETCQALVRSAALDASSGLVWVERVAVETAAPGAERADAVASVGPLAELSREQWLVILCGHYEGFDERIRTLADAREISIGDYVLSGGEPAAMVLVDAVVRLLPGALGHEQSAELESFADGVLEYPQYTRPREYRGLSVPDVLLSGDHGKIADWRRQQALHRTRERRPDLLE